MDALTWWRSPPSAPFRRPLLQQEVIRPRGASFELVRIPPTNVILFPWRYATDSQLRREDARMRTSGIRRELLTATVDGRGQLTLDHAGVQDEELEAQLAEEEALAAELRSFARVVTIGYASNPTGILDLGWGDAELVDEDGQVHWEHWEPLIAQLRARRAPGPRAVGESAGLRAAPEAATAAPRFDAAPFEGDFDLQPRNPLAAEPEREGGPDAGQTGTGDDRR